MAAEREVRYHHGCGLWCIVEVDGDRERWEIGAWLNSTDAEEHLFDDDIEWEDWGPRSSGLLGAATC